MYLYLKTSSGIPPKTVNVTARARLPLYQKKIVEEFLALLSLIL
jgi:hypothetical protein